MLCGSAGIPFKTGIDEYSAGLVHRSSGIGIRAALSFGCVRTTPSAFLLREGGNVSLLHHLE